jgi:hypothetical protein
MPRPDPVALFGEEGCGFVQDLPLLAQRAHLAAQLAQLLALTRRQRLTCTVVDVGVLHPVAERLVRDPEVLGDAGQGAVTAADEAHRLGFELRRIGRLGAGHGNTSSWASCPMIECPPKGGNSSNPLGTDRYAT